MKQILLIPKMNLMALVGLMSLHTFSQPTDTSVMDALQYGVVLDDPKMKEVKAQLDITYLSDEKGTLKLDLYSPPRVECK